MAADTSRILRRLQPRARRHAHIGMQRAGVDCTAGRTHAQRNSRRTDPLDARGVRPERKASREEVINLTGL